MKTGIIAFVLGLLILYPSSGELCYKNCHATTAGQTFVRQFEGYSPVIYADAGGLPTIGYGHLIKKGEKFTEPLLPADAQKLFLQDIAPAEEAINNAVKIPQRTNQFDAEMSFTYNVGVRSFTTSHLLQKVNSKQNAGPEFLKWVYVDGKKVKGLANRRSAEKILYEARQ